MLLQEKKKNEFITNLKINKNNSNFFEITAQLKMYCQSKNEN